MKYLIRLSRKLIHYTLAFQVAYTPLLVWAEQIQVELAQSENIRALGDGSSSGTSSPSRDPILVGLAVLPKGTVISIDSKELEEVKANPDKFNHRYLTGKIKNGRALSNLSLHGFLNNVRIISIPPPSKNEDEKLKVLREDLNNNKTYYFSLKSILTKTKCHDSSPASTTDTKACEEALDKAGNRTGRHIRATTGNIPVAGRAPAEVASVMNQGSSDSSSSPPRCFDPKLAAKGVGDTLGEFMDSINYLNRIFGANYSSSPLNKCSGSSPLSSSYGTHRTRTRNHQGYDFSKKIGTPVTSMCDGVVEESRTRDGYGEEVTIKCDKPMGPIKMILYGHLNERKVRQGQRVTAEQLIGTVGRSGTRATGPHLHLQFLKVDALKNIKDYVRGEDLEKLMSRDFGNNKNLPTC